MDLFKVQKCARESLKLGDAVEKLNLSNFGSDDIKNKISMFETVCEVDKFDVANIKRQVQGGVSDIKEEKYEWAQNSFKLAREQIFSAALRKISEGV